MIESICDLNNTLTQKNSKLFLFYGDLMANLKSFLKFNNKIGAIYLNQDYTPFSLQRDDEIKKICNESNLDFYLNLLQWLDFFTVYTPYCQAAMTFPVKKPDLFSDFLFASESEINVGEKEENKPIKDI